MSDYRQNYVDQILMAVRDDPLVGLFATFGIRG